MNLIIQGRHIEVTPAINSYIKNKIKKVKAHFDQIIHAHAVVETLRGSQTAEITITVDHHHFHNKVSSENLYKSIDLLMDKIERQVRRYKEYRDDKSKKNEKLTFHLQEITEINQGSKIKIEDLEISSKPMNDLEAVLQLRADSHRQVFGYKSSFDSLKPNYLEKITETEFNLISFDHYWEKKEVILISENKLEINQVQSIRPSMESIEHAIEFLSENEEKYRFFISVRNQKSMLLNRIDKNHFELIREKI